MPELPRNLRVEAVVLRHSDWGEADRVLVLFTREHGKLRCIAKGARKLHSRKAGHLEPFTRATLMLARGRDFWIVTQAETVQPYLAIRADLTRTAHAAYAVELLDRFTYEEGQNRALYTLLVDTLARLDTGEDIFTLVRYYELSLLEIAGYRPELQRCVSGGETIQPQDQFFAAAGGGVLCPRCGPGTSGVKPVSLEALRYLRHFQRSSYAEARRARVPGGVQDEMAALMQYYLTYLLERGLNTPGFIRQVGSQPEA
ncbi:MAG: DNA repair protein RecO [Anaerolineae bacterium]|nr:DNA repair protein RecO [Anaerolineae bacterium]